MTQDIFQFWSEMQRGQKIHSADIDVFRRLDPKRHGFELECLPHAWSGPLRSASVVLLYLSPGFVNSELEDAKRTETIDYYYRLWKGDEPHRDDPDWPGTTWLKSRTKSFGDWNDVRRKLAILEIGAYHSSRLNDYSVLASLPSSRVSLEWAQSVLFPEAEAGERVVVCMRSAPYWGLQQGTQHKGTLFAIC